MMFHMFIFVTAMACADYTHFGGDNAGDMILAGVVFIFASLFRFFVVSFLVDDVRMVQSIYFYGSLMLMYVMCVLWLNIVFVSSNGNVASTPSRIMTFICAFLDPTFGFGLFALFKRNFLGATSMHPGIENSILPAMVASMGLMLFLLLFIEGGNDFEAFFSYCWLRVFGGDRVTDDFNTRTSIFGHETLTNDQDEDMQIDESGGKGRASFAEPRERMVGEIDPDIKEEKRRVATAFMEKRLSLVDHAIFIYNISKVFHGRGSVPTKVAVDNVSVAIGLGEVFGLLGANGAGKVCPLLWISFA